MLAVYARMALIRAHDAHWEQGLCTVASSSYVTRIVFTEVYDMIFHEVWAHRVMEETTPVVFVSIEDIKSHLNFVRLKVR